MKAGQLRPQRGEQATGDWDVLWHDAMMGMFGHELQVFLSIQSCKGKISLQEAALDVA